MALVGYNITQTTSLGLKLEDKEDNLKDVCIWGTGTPKREFLYVDDLANACIHLMNLPKKTFWMKLNPMCSHINIGTGKDCSILELAKLVAETIGFPGTISCDTTKPDGTPRKLLDVNKLNGFNWSYSTELQEGLSHAYKDFKKYCQA